MENPRNVGIGPQTWSFGPGGWGQQAILRSGETKVMALEEPPNPS